MTIVSVLGWSDSGKSTVVAAIIAAAGARGVPVAAVKVSPHLQSQDRGDTARFLDAGAAPVFLRSSRGWTVQLPEDRPLEAGSEPISLPRWMTAMLATTDPPVELLVVEGRMVDGAILVQTASVDGEVKFPGLSCDAIVADAPTNPLPEELKRRIFG